MYHKNSILIIIISCITLLQIDVKAQEKFHISPQISNLQIRDIRQDSLGYIWIATARGVNRYNGYEYAQLFRNTSEPNASIQSNRINRLHIDKKNNLWIATSRGVSQYDMAKNQVIPYNNIENDDEYYAADLAEDKKGNIWIATYNDGIFKIDPDKNQMENIPIIYRGKETPKYIRTLYIDNQNNLWIGYAGGSALGKYNIDGQTSELNFLPKHTAINCITKFGETQLWIGTDQGVIAYNIRERKTTQLPTSLRRQKELNASKINSITLIDNDNYIITSTRRAYKYCITTSEVTILSTGAKENNKNNDITCALKDNQGNLWLGTVEQSFYKIKTSENIFDNLQELNGKPVTSSCEDPHFDRIWIGTKYDGLYQYSKKSGKATSFTTPHLSNRSQAPTIRVLYCDSQNRIWIGAGRYLIVGQLNPTGFTETAVLDNLSIIATINEDRQGNVWVGSYSGLYFFKKNSTLSPHTVLENASVTAIAPLDQDKIAYTIYGTDIFVTDSRHFESKALNPKDSLNNTYVLNACSDLYMAQDSVLWISNYNRGVMCYDPQNHTIKTFTQKNGLPSNDILSVTEDKNGHIWLATSNGLSRLDPKSGRLRNFSEADGLSNTQFFEQAILTASDGSIYLGGNSGIDRFDPANIKQNGYQPSVVLEDLRIQNRSVTPGEKEAPIDKNIAFARKIILKHRQNSFSIDYVGIDYTYTDKLRYAYKLEGFDKEWIETDGNKRAYFTNLPAGDYRFLLKAQNGDGEWSPEIGIDITVKASPWLTGWAYLFYFAAIVSGIILATKIYFRRKYNKKSQELVEQQHRHEQEINRQKIDFYGNISHELRTPLTLINGNIELLAQNARTGIHDMKLISILSYNSGRLLKLVNQLLDFSRMESGSTPLRVSKLDFNPILQNVINSFRFSVQAKEIEYDTNTDQSLPMIYTDDDLLEKIVTNLLSNAVKYTPRKGRIRIDVSYAAARMNNASAFDTETMTISITNSCEKIEPDELKRLFDRFTRLTGNEDIPGSGIGLHYTKTLISRLHGEINASWNETDGLTMTFTIPIGKEAFAAEEIVETAAIDEGETNEEPDSDSSEVSETVEENDNTTSPPSAKMHTLLIVEDDPQIHTLLHEIMHHEYNVLHAYDGAEGLQMIRSQMPDIVISDIRMPEMDGIALCKTVKNDPQLCHVILILLTAKNRIEERIEGYNCGADAYINKPFRADHLISIIHNQQANRDRMKAFFHSQNPAPEQNDDDNDTRIPDSLSEIDRRFLEKLHQFIDKSIENPDININVIAVELGFSRTSFYRKMKGLTGLAPNDYVRNFKMKKAAKLILEGNLSIAEISDQTGFGTQSHFSTAFKKYFGVSPKDYKEKWKSEQQKNRTK